jgi:hypothetical protein
VSEKESSREGAFLKKRIRLRRRVFVVWEAFCCCSSRFWWGEAKKRGIDIQLATAETASSFHHYIPTRNRAKNKQEVLSYMGKKHY